MRLWKGWIALSKDNIMDNSLDTDIDVDIGLDQDFDICMSEDCEVSSCDRHMTVRDPKLKKNLITRLNRVEGQVRGIKGMVEKDVYCDDILNQISAVQSAITSISKLVLENHVRGCLVKKIEAGEDDIIDELMVTVGKLMK